MANTSSSGNLTIQRPAGLPEEALTAYNVYLSCTIAFGVPGNLLVLLVYLKYGPVTGTDWFIIFITIYDFISSTISVPVYLTFTTGAWRHYGNDIICKCHMFLSQSVVLSSTFLICGLALERYCKVCRPKSTTFTRTKSRNACIGISVGTTMLSVPCFVFYQNRNVHCGTVMDGLLLQLLMAYYTLMLLLFLTAVAILLFAYTRIAITILQSEINMLHHNSDDASQEIKMKHRFGAFLTICCRKNKVYPYSQSKLNPLYTGPTSNDRSSQIYTEKDTEERSIKFKCYSNPVSITDNNGNESEPTERSLITSTVNLQNISVKQSMLLKNGFSHQNTEKTNISKSLLEVPKIRRTSDTKTEPRRIGWSSLATPLVETPTAVSPTTIRRTSNSQILMNIKRLNENRRLRRSLKTTRIAFLICLIFVLSWLPPWISFVNFVFVSPTAKQSPTYLAINMFCKMTHLVNSFANPILYTVLNKTFREKLKRFICRK